MEKLNRRRLRIHKRFIAAAILFSLLWQGLAPTARLPRSSLVQAEVLGTAIAPIPIDSVQGLKDIANGLNKHYILTADIVLNTIQYWVPLGRADQPFTGSLDGNGHTIENLTIIAPIDNLGLFAFISDATIKDLTLENVNIQGRDYVSALVASAVGVSLIQNCSVTGLVQGRTYVGGLVANYNGSGRIEDSAMAGEVSSTGIYTGGLVGAYSGSGGIEYANMSGEVNAYTECVGGLVGRLDGGYVQNSRNAADVTSSVGQSIGGIVGIINVGIGNGIDLGSEFVTIEDCYNSGAIFGSSVVGGIVGMKVYGGAEIFNVGNSGAVTANATIVGGIAGCIYESGLIQGAANLGNVKGEGDAGGIAGRIEGTANILNSYNRGNITAARDCAGIVAYMTCIDGYGIQYCYSTGDLTAVDIAGGLVGIGDRGKIEDSFAMNDRITVTSPSAHRIIAYWRFDLNANLSGNMAYEDMIITENGVETSIKSENPSHTSADGMNGAKAIVIQNSSYLELMGWDFQNIWEIGEDYPVLQNHDF